MRDELEGWFLGAVARVRPDRLVHAALAPRAASLRDATVLALGKAAGPMIEAADRALGGSIAERVCVAPDGAPAPAYALRAAHPVPDARSMDAARALLAAAARARGPVVALISGGGSALAALPADGVSLDDKIAVVQQLAAAGAPIPELNCVRRHLSAIKGGRLARAAAGPVLTLAVSDVIGDRLFDIASGPTVADPTSAADAGLIVARRLRGAAPPAVIARLEALASGALDDDGLRAPRPGDEAILLAGRRALVDAALAVGAGRGMAPAAWPAPLDGAVDDVADLLAGWILGEGPGGDASIVAGGEPVVALPPSPGQGGRAQQLALAVARRLDGHRGVAFLAAGSDGIDGDGPAAGAIVDGGTWGAIRAAGVDPAAALARCDAGRALEAVGATLVTGPTGANHADLMIAVRVGATALP